MRIANGLEMLEISANRFGNISIIHPTLIWDEDTVILVDTGYSNQLSQFQEAMVGVGVPFERLNKIVITHQDLDHIGGLPTILSAASQKVEVLANEVEKPYIQGDKRLVKLTPEVMANLDSFIPAGVPEEQRKAFKATFENPPKAPVDRVVRDGEELPYCGGIIVINTPGHTPGHISLYHKQSKTLIAGDAMVVDSGQLLASRPQFTFDMKLALQSLEKLAQYDIETVICYHGGLYQDQVNQRIAELAKG